MEGGRFRRSTRELSQDRMENADRQCSLKAGSEEHLGVGRVGVKKPIARCSRLVSEIVFLEESK